MVAGFVTPDAGEVRFNGRDITSLSPEARARLGLVRSFQAARLFPTMTVLDTVAVAQEGSQPVRMVPAMLGLGRSEKARYARAHDMVDLLGLGPLARRPVGELSTGTRRMVELAASLALDPEVLLLDEPAGGIAQSEGDVLVELFNAVRSELGTTLVVIEHDLPLLFRLADRLVAMELGAVIAQGSPDEVRNHPDVVRSYLGGEIAAVERSGSALFSHPANQDAAAAAAPEVPAGV
jgi:ABC-type branched-subunit amino acid transport system ATPase component